MEEYKVRQVPDQSGRILRSVGYTLEIQTGLAGDFSCHLATGRASLLEPKKCLGDRKAEALC
jgi:hypothetical protein